MEYLEQLKTQLVEASRSDAGESFSRARPRRGLRAWARRHTYVSVIAGLALMMGATAAIGDAAGLFEEDLTAPSPSGIASSIPSSIESSFAIARTARTTQDTLPAEAVQSLEASGSLAVHYGVNPALARFAASISSTSVWLVPGDTGSCIWIEGQGAECGPNELVSTQGLALAAVPVSGSASSVIGILPDGASVTASNEDGSSANVTTSGDAYYIVGQAATTQPVIHTAAGTTVKLGTLSAKPAVPNP